MPVRLLAIALSVIALAWTGPRLPAADKSEAPMKVLIFSKTKGFRHDCIETATAAVKKLGEDNGFVADATEDAAQFTVPVLRQYKAVIFLCTTGNDLLDAGQKKIFEDYVRAGNGWVGVHSASDTEYNWPFYGQLVGAYFKSHPGQQKAKIIVIDKNHPATAHLPEVWERFDEWYNFRKAPDKVHVLLAIDEQSYQPGGDAMGVHPMAWCQDVGAGRAFYTELGHTKESYADPLYLKHLLGGILYAAGSVDAAGKGKAKK